MAMLVWAGPCSSPPSLTHLPHALYDVGGQVQVQVHCEHDAVVVFNGEDTHVVCQGLVKTHVS